MVKVERSYPAPKSLAIEAAKKNGSYRESDVINQLERDFHGKCYICELKGLQDPNVEHLLPHKNGKYSERKFDWDNLFLCCNHCNGIKNSSKYDEGILDCCKLDPERYLNFELKEDNVTITENGNNDDTVKRTVMLVQEVFGKQDTGLRTYAIKERLDELQKEMNILYKNLGNYKEKPTSSATLRRLRILLGRESAFAAFKRSYVRNHSSEYPQLQEYVKTEDYKWNKSK
jgi:uncharacterized protein (TIGR02646 family)